MTYAAQVRSHYQSSADASRAPAMKQYMRQKFDFFGIVSPLRKEITRQFWKQYGLPSIESVHQEILELWNMPERELQYMAIETFQKLAKKIEANHITTIEYMLTHKQWWDTVDFIASDLAGNYFKRFPENRNEFIPKWQVSKDMWLNRSAILFQLKYKNETDTEILAQSILKHTDSKEFFIQKAIGWALRQYSKTNAEWVREFIQNNKMANLSVREASKYI